MDQFRVIDGEINVPIADVLRTFRISIDDVSDKPLSALRPSRALFHNIINVSWSSQEARSYKSSCQIAKLMADWELAYDSAYL